MVHCFYTAALLLVSLHAAAQSAVYRCDSGGKISYGSVPCVGGTALAQATEGSGGNGQPDSSVARQKALADLMARERHQREAQEQREQQKAAARRLQCDKLRLHKKWRDEDVARASASARAKMQAAARRSAEELALSCPP
jgi:hypothetical protein